jgi:hypothetical protein
LQSTGFRDNVSQTFKTSSSSGIPKLLAEAISDDVGLGSLGGFVGSSELFELCLVLVAWSSLLSKFSSLGLVSLKGLKLGSLKLTGTLTDESISCECILSLLL